MDNPIIRSPICEIWHISIFGKSNRNIIKFLTAVAIFIIRGSTAAAQGNMSYVLPFSWKSTKAATLSYVYKILEFLPEPTKKPKFINYSYCYWNMSHLVTMELTCLRWLPSNTDALCWSCCPRSGWRWWWSAGHRALLNLLWATISQLECPTNATYYRTRAQPNWKIYRSKEITCRPKRRTDN